VRRAKHWDVESDKKTRRHVTFSGNTGSSVKTATISSPRVNDKKNSGQDQRRYDLQMFSGYDGLSVSHLRKTRPFTFQLRFAQYHDDGRFNCFVCLKGFSGRGAIDFVKLMQTVDFQQATEFLRRYANIAQLKKNRL
jgi:hypothetical protein